MSPKLGRKAASLNRKILATAAKLERLQAVLRGETIPVDTTDDRPASVVSTKRWDALAAHHTAMEIISGDPQLSHVAPGDLMMILYLEEFSPALYAKVTTIGPDRMNHCEAFHEVRRMMGHDPKPLPPLVQ